jgi:hypothetical protein
MGRRLGEANRKPYTRVTGTIREALLKEYADGETQTALARKYGLSQGIVSRTVRTHGKTRSPQEAQPPTFDVEEAVRLFTEEKRTTYEIADILGVSQSPVWTHLRRRGVNTSQKDRGQKYKFFDRDFFAEVNHMSAYWAGFAAADGCVHEENDTLSFGIHPDDRELLERFKVAARLDQPITLRPNNTGRIYAWMNVTCPRWVEALALNFNVTPRKSLTIQPPVQIDRAFVWSFIRGVFDGDGHAKADGSTLQITSGSLPFLTWIVRDVFRAHHALYSMPYERKDGTHSEAWGCAVCGDVFRDVVRLLYADSTPETRLARKYARFKAAGVL